MSHERFARRASRRLETVADRLEGEGEGLGTGGEAAKSKAQAQEIRVAALLVREEAVAVGREERESSEEKVAENLSLEAQG